MNLCPLALPFIFNEPVYRINRPFTIIISRPWQELTPEAQASLFRLIQALGFPAAGVPIVHRPVLENHYLATLASRVIVAFGASFTARPPDLYTVHNTGSGTVILADDMNRLAADKDAKQKLWNILKPLFSHG
ncbi:MAG: hypothetical protein KatS3mg032_0690 [Cyclobacteriaceae bacterium]|nr:MAG: hypothetical protein KatS3mg032_0690 [Cyclobacteriaceae bacterium]